MAVARLSTSLSSKQARPTLSTSRQFRSLPLGQAWFRQDGLQACTGLLWKASRLRPGYDPGPVRGEACEQAGTYACRTLGHDASQTKELALPDVGNHSLVLPHIASTDPQQRATARRVRTKGMLTDPSTWPAIVKTRAKHGRKKETSGLEDH